MPYSINVPRQQCIPVGKPGAAESLPLIRPDLRSGLPVSRRFVYVRKRRKRVAGICGARGRLKRETARLRAAALRFNQSLVRAPRDQAQADVDCIAHLETPAERGIRAHVEI